VARQLAFVSGGLAPDMELMEGFWDRYLQVGRAAIDPEHDMHFSGGERYSINGDQRECYGAVKSNRRFSAPRTVYDETWVNRKRINPCNSIRKILIGGLPQQAMLNATNLAEMPLRQRAC